MQASHDDEDDVLERRALSLMRVVHEIERKPLESHKHMDNSPDRRQERQPLAADHNESSPRTAPGLRQSLLPPRSWRLIIAVLVCIFTTLIVVSIATSDRTALHPLSPIVFSGFTTSENVRTFAWTAPTLTVRKALANAYPDRIARGWRFDEINTTLAWDDLVAWVQAELLGGVDPFAEAAGRGRVPVPWPADRKEDNLPAGGYVGYSRRQLCFLVAKAMIGARADGYNSGLARFLSKRPGWVGANCTPRQGDFGRSFTELLATCAADPTLAHGAHGPMLLVAKGRRPPSVTSLRAAAVNASLTYGSVRLCAYTASPQPAAIPLTGAEHFVPVPSEGCLSPPADDHGFRDRGPGIDFLSGGSRHSAGQAIQDISADFGGGYVFGNVCGLGGGEDERLMVYMPEVAALVFWLSASQLVDQGDPRPQLRVPFWVLGARSLLQGLDGEGRYDRRVATDPRVPFKNDLAIVALPRTAGVGASRMVRLSTSRPFAAFMSPNQDFLGVPESAHGADVRTSRHNRHPRQRAIDQSLRYSFEHQVAAWYGAMAPNQYHPAVRPAWRALVSSIGAGPWGAGLWWGDSQVMFLAAWLGQVLAGSSGSGGSDVPLDYYLYSAFTENPGNQCLVLGRAACRECLAACADRPLPASAYWLPDWAFFGNGDAKMCVGHGSRAAAEELCGETGVADVIATYTGGSVSRLWMAAESAMSRVSVNSTVFDLMLLDRRPPDLGP